MLHSVNLFTVQELTVLSVAICIALQQLQAVKLSHVLVEIDTILSSFCRCKTRLCAVQHSFTHSHGTQWHAASARSCIQLYNIIACGTHR